MRRTAWFCGRSTQWSHLGWTTASPSGHELVELLLPLVDWVTAYTEASAEDSESAAG
ncbi:hypothetical protein ABIA32_005341 [Streptacidiphilus sp. MAP12-20]